MKEAVVNGSEAPPGKERKTRAGTDWWGEAKGIFWLILVVLGFHSFIAKPFYIPSESMLTGLQVGDRLVVNKFAYGWSFVSPTIPNPVAIFDSLVLRRHEDSWAVQLPFHKGRLLGRLPERGDVVIVTPPGTNSDYIKRVIGLPGDRLQVKGGIVFLNGAAVQRGSLHYVDVRHYGGTVMADGTETCDVGQYGPAARVVAADGSATCRLPVVTETLPGGRRYDTVELGPSMGDDYGAITIPADHVFLMGDNRDRSADSRFPLSELGLGGPVPYENIGGRAEFVTFSFDGSASWLNPLSWWRSLRPGRAGVSLHPAETRR
ncbi:signal peptidase I [Sphingomonas bacterium]|uniref:signal peptidase I n=1 Tax=Sphingomonas bacterium TaxID=1895847 RepID=UPI001577053B|nr:signal peptidase I [Sphingomonas bacterium]